MDESLEPPPVTELVQSLQESTDESLSERFNAYHQVKPERRKELLRALRSLADEQASALRPVIPQLIPFLTDEERSVRLTTAKLFVVLAKEKPDAVVDTVDTLANRLADEEEFYYVRARSAEALGYVAIEYSEEVATPELLADLRIGLSFDEPEVKSEAGESVGVCRVGEPTALAQPSPESRGAPQ